MRAALLLASALLLVPALGAAHLQPGDVDPWWARSLLDRDRDGVDDALALRAGSAHELVLVSYATMPDARQRDALRQAGFPIAHEYANFPVLAVRAPPARFTELAASPGVVLVERNDVLVPLLKESVPLVGANLAWSRYDVRGDGVVVAILDDGAYEAHPDFEGRIVASHDAAASSRAFGGSPDVVTPAGEKGHGTHVTGILMGPGSRSDGVYRGVAPASLFANVKVFSGPDQTTSDLVLRGLDWVLSNKHRLDIRVAVLSLGGRPSDGSDALSKGVDIAVDRGLIVVAATGNQGPDERTVSSPGAAEKAITVGAVDKQKRVASFSSRGPTLDGRLKPDLVAPGVGITSTVPPVSTTSVGGVLGGQRNAYYGQLSGSSMAAPHVAGIVALMLEANPELRPHDVKRILLATAQDVGARGLDNDTGYGFVNGIAAVQVANDPRLLDSPQFAARLATIPDPPPEDLLARLSFEARSIGFGVVGISLTAALASSFIAAIVWWRRRG